MQIGLVSDEMIQDIGVDVKNNYILYHAKNVHDDNEVWLIQDFNIVSRSDVLSPVLFF